ncbi:MAG: asparagine synthetase B [Sphingomonas sp.]|jgi:asparagine synthase (glutamine-hydrolysing)|uniref:asparagine synthetase B family protein n=1 Tax=Sphingomonas sp. TaxID=28214 RepID=UPI0035682265
MGEFAGVLRRDGAEIDPKIVERLERSLGGVGGCHRVRSGPVALCHRRLRAIELDLALQPQVGPVGTITVVDCRLDEPLDVAAALGDTGGGRRDDAALVAAACRRWGAGAAERLNGSFALAHWDEIAHRLVLARDGLGTRALFYAEDGQHLFFASSVQSLLALPQVQRDLDELVVAQYLTLEPQDNEQTVYRHIRRVPPGGMIVVDRGAPRRSLYWTLENIAPVRFKRDDDYVAAARDLLDRAVACRLPTQGGLGVHLSGGLDSAGLAATAARLLGDNGFEAFHRAPGAAHPYDVMDERSLVESVAARYPNMALTVIDDNRQYAADIEPEIDAARYNVPHLRTVNAGWFEPLIEAARRSGISVMLTGGCGNATLSWEGRPHFAGDLRAGRLIRTWRGMAAAAGQRQQTLPRYLAGNLVKPLLPRHLLERRARRLSGGRSPWSAYTMVSDDFLESLDYATRVRGTDDDRLLPPKIGAAARLRGLQTQRNRDMQSAVRRANRHEAIDPYADRRLVEFTLGIPEAQFWNAGQDRWLARRVLADRLPPALVNEHRRGAQCPEWYDIVSARRDGMVEAVDRLSRSPLATRMVDIPRMKALLDDWPDASAAKSQKQIYGHALARGIAIGGFLRWYEGGNE